MIYWNIIIALLFVFVFITYLNKDRNKNIKETISLAISFLFLFILYVFKDNTIFPDLEIYLKAFDYSLKVDWDNVERIKYFIKGVDLEIGWCYYTKLLSSIYPQSELLVVSSGIFILFVYLNTFRKYSEIPWLSVFLFITTIFYNSLFVLRQNMAVAICLLSIPYIIKRKFLKSLLIILIASSFHNSAIIFIIVYFFNTIKIDRKYFISIALFSILIYSFFYTIISYISLYLIRYQSYLLESDQRANYTGFLISLSILLFVSRIYYPFKEIKESDKLFFQMLVIILVINISRVGLKGSIGRLNLYFLPAICIILPNATSMIKNPFNKSMLIVGIMILYFILMIRQMNYGFDLGF